jgi:hypothetical protein
MSDNPSPKKPSRPIDPSPDGRLADLFMVALGVSVATIAIVGAFWIVGSLVFIAFK